MVTRGKTSSLMVGMSFALLRRQEVLVICTKEWNRECRHVD